MKLFVKETEVLVVPPDGPGLVVGGHLEVEVRVGVLAVSRPVQVLLVFFIQTHLKTQQRRVNIYGKCIPHQSEQSVL